MAKLERRPAEHVALAGLIVQMVCGVLAAVFAGISGAATVYVLAWQTLIGVLLWATCLMRLRQSRLADEETAEWKRLQAERAVGGARGDLFEADEIQAFAARNRLRILERYISPMLSVIIALLVGVAVFVTLWTNRIPLSQVNRDRALVSVAFVSVITFVLFLIAMYAAGMSRQAEWRSLRAASSFMMFSTVLGAAAFVALALGYFGFPRPDRLMAYVMLGLLAIVGVETILNFVLDFYRPRVEGVEPRPACDSRLLGLISQPSGILKTVAATLDYQFGFRVSQTWFYRFVEQAIAPLILFQILTLYLLTCFVIVGPEQQGVVERFGKFQKVIGPGLATKWPWPIESAYRFAANEVKTLELGHAGEYKAGETMLWTQQHYDTEYNVMVATREAVTEKRDVPAVSLIVASSTVRYRVSDPKKWYYGCSEPESILEALCNREMIKYLAGVDLFDVMGPGRARASAYLRRSMQQAADELDGAIGKGLGVEILGVGLEGIHPPIAEQIPQAFHERVIAKIQKEVDQLESERSEIEVMYKAESDAQGIRYQAQADYAESVFEAKASAERFQVLNMHYRDAEEVFRAREYLSVLEDAMKNVRLYVLSVAGLDREHIRLNLEDPVRLDVGDIAPFEEVHMPESKKE